MLAVMLHHSRFRNWLLALLCAVLLLGRLGGFHVHLCFDGMEPPSSVHLFDSGVHHAEPGMETSHADVDVAIAGDLTSRNKIEWSLALALLVVILLPGRRRRAHGFAVAFASCVLPALPPFLRPPLRGPPQPTSR